MLVTFLALYHIGCIDIKELHSQRTCSSVLFLVYLTLGNIHPCSHMGSTHPAAQDGTWSDQSSLASSGRIWRVPRSAGLAHLASVISLSPPWLSFHPDHCRCLGPFPPAPPPRCDQSGPSTAAPRSGVLFRRQHLTAGGFCAASSHY